MKTLHKTIKKQWFDMIEAKIKKHEYLDIKDYWCVRLLGIHIGNKSIDELSAICDSHQQAINDYPNVVAPSFDVIHAFNGGSPCLKYPNIKWKHKGITVGEGNPEWGAEPGKKYFILHIGELLT